jgi:hypothetical protein
MITYDECWASYCLAPYATAYDCQKVDDNDLYYNCKLLTGKTWKDIALGMIGEEYSNTYDDLFENYFSDLNIQKSSSNTFSLNDFFEFSS